MSKDNNPFQNARKKSVEEIFPFEINKEYSLQELLKYIKTPTGFAQHRFGATVADIVEKGMKKAVLDPNFTGQTPEGEVPMIKVIYENTIDEGMKWATGGKCPPLKPVARVQFDVEERACYLEFDNTEVGESEMLYYYLTDDDRVICMSAFSISDTKVALLLISLDNTFIVSSIMDRYDDTEATPSSETDGDYAFSKDNPIRLCSVEEEYAYLKRLRYASSSKRIVGISRLGSCFHDGGILDEWQITLQNAQNGCEERVSIYMDAYSMDSDFDKAPKGFVL